MDNHHTQVLGFGDPEEYDLSLAEAAALVSWDEAAITRWTQTATDGFGLLPALRTPDGLRFRTTELLAYCMPGVDVTTLSPELIAWAPTAFAAMARFSGRLPQLPTAATTTASRNEEHDDQDQ